jgi:flagellar hook-associated protein 3 FlgL
VERGEVDMRVTFNTNMADLQHAIGVASDQMVTAQRQLSTGRRLNVASDDPNDASAAVAERTEMAATEQYKAAADSVTSRLSVLDSALSELVNQATSAQSAALSARGSVLKPTQREAIASELETIRDAVVTIMNTRFRGTYLFSGNEPTVAPYTKSGTTISDYQGGSGSVEVDIDRQAAVRVGFPGDEVIKGSSSQDLIRVLDDLAAAARSGDETALADGTTALNEAFTRLTAVQSTVGNDMAQVDTRKEQLNIRTLSSQTRLSKLEDADLSKAVSDMNRADIAYQAALKAVGNASKPTLLDYLT